MKIEKITPEQALEIIQCDELFTRISDDFTIKDRVNSLPSDHFYFGIYVDDELIGFFWLHPENTTTWLIHCNILQKHRPGNALDAGKAILKYVYFKMPTVHKLNAKIPVCYQDVYNYTKKFGFQDEGLDRESKKIGGIFVDQHLLGLTRTEFSKWAL